MHEPPEREFQFLNTAPVYMQLDFSFRPAKWLKLSIMPPRVEKVAPKHGAVSNPIYDALVKPRTNIHMRSQCFFYKLYKPRNYNSMHYRERLEDRRTEAEDILDQVHYRIQGRSLRHANAYQLRSSTRCWAHAQRQRRKNTKMGRCHFTARKDHKRTRLNTVTPA